MEILQNSIEVLSNALRRNAEAMANFGYLFKVDKEEGVTNLDRAFESILEAFHTVYDITPKERFNFFDHADTSILIMLRNAIHHRNHLLFKSLYCELLLGRDISNLADKELLLANYTPATEGQFIAERYLKVSDFYDRIDDTKNSPDVDTRMLPRAKTKMLNLINDKLNFNKIKEHCSSNNISLKQTYVNIMPILSSAMSRLFKNLEEHNFKPIGYDSEVYFSYFPSLAIDLTSLNFTTHKIPHDAKEHDLKKIIFESITTP